MLNMFPWNHLVLITRPCKENRSSIWNTWYAKGVWLCFGKFPQVRFVNPFVFNFQVGYICVSTSHYNDVIMGAIASQITSLTIIYSTVYSDADQRKHQSSASLAFVREFHRGPVNSPHKWPVTRKMFSFDDVIMMKGRPPSETSLWQ